MSYIDLLTQLKNAQAVGKERIKYSFSKLDEKIVSVLVENGFVAGFEKKGRGPKKFLDIILAYEKDRGAIDGLKFISTPSRRIYKKHQLIRPVRQGFGMAVVSTSQGIMTDKEVRKKKIGGQVLFEIW
ncbi:30S ribosomal protein S8 [Candidatus Wolfebacteria bacterium GWA1_42_9]|uniref:Small ribosomal subunit protein uS8 n=1 Tax=Candidatus Wolfebacteria bacterium GWA1_42_9 TaxID=1802553 RepID=A0A1F8DNA5_9BACT|nr:MAG: 30S ribosomal protein S8 [Parcubacteria group bacterium GW2011_GWB1_43_8b]OGM89922.1 MAG: 30S ribosomal protein S8 [Candidatus Wolfebacteria bacterium GWA1_42_9]